MALERMVRSRDPETSWDAAAAADDDTLSTVERVTLIIINERSRTDEEIYAQYLVRVARGDCQRVSPQRVRTARADLVRQNWVRDSGKDRPSTLGNRSTVWEISK